VESAPGSASFGPKIFFIWGAFCVIAFFFVWYLVYETSKISLEQIDEMYERVDHAWNSPNFEPSWSFQQILDQGWSPSGIPEHELQTTASQNSADTTLGDSGSSTITIQHSDEEHQTRPSNENKTIPMASVDFSY
jgi:hypothetical protein